MNATLNSPAGIETLTRMVESNQTMPPGIETWGFVENLAAFLSGDTAMTISWPPYGRWAAGDGTDQEALSWVPQSQIAGKVGYALPPGGHPLGERVRRTFSRPYPLVRCRPVTCAYGG
jgi:multiple sugar transport system substrate-binding protein